MSSIRNNNNNMRVSCGIDHVGFQKKFKITKHRKISLMSLRCHPKRSELCVGGTMGYLRYVRILSLQDLVSQPLVYHSKKSTVHVVRWNAHLDRLVSADMTGRIVISSLCENKWNDVSKRRSDTDSPIADIAWSNGSSGEFCIIYESGLIILSDINGKRVWSKLTQPRQRLKFVRFSPDNSLILVAAEREEGTYDRVLILKKEDGKFIDYLPLSNDTRKIASVEWHPSTEDGKILIVFSDGENMKMFKDEKDEYPVIIRGGYNNEAIVDAKLSQCGNYIAVASSRRVDFYDTFGRKSPIFIEIPLPLNKENGQTLIREICWNNNDKTLVIGDRNTVYLARVRKKYIHCKISKNNMLVYAISEGLVFWNTRTNFTILKRREDLFEQGELYQMKSNDHFMYLITCSRTRSKEGKIRYEEQIHIMDITGEKVNILNRRDFLTHLSLPMGKNKIISTSKTFVCVHLNIYGDNMGVMFCVNKEKKSMKNPILSLEARSPLFFLGRESGTVDIYRLNREDDMTLLLSQDPNRVIQLMTKITFKSRISKLFVSSDLRRCGIIGEWNNSLGMYRLEFDDDYKCRTVKCIFKDDASKKNVISMSWSEDEEQNDKDEIYYCLNQSHELKVLKGEEVVGRPLKYSESSSSTVVSLLRFGSSPLRVEVARLEDLVLGGKELLDKMNMSREEEQEEGERYHRFINFHQTSTDDRQQMFSSGDTKNVDEIFSVASHDDHSQGKNEEEEGEEEEVYEMKFMEPVVIPDNYRGSRRNSTNSVPGSEEGSDDQTTEIQESGVEKQKQDENFKTD